MSEKLLFVDCETTGTSFKDNDPWQFALVIEIDGKVEDKKLVYSRPINMSKVTTVAMEMARQEDGSPMTIDAYAQLPEPKIAYNYIKEIFKNFVDPYNKSDKFTAIGQNVDFDLNMISSWFKKLGDKYFGSWVDRGSSLDTLGITRWFRHLGIIPNIVNCKLGTICNCLGIELPNAHNAMCDIMATRELYCRYRDAMRQIKGI